MPAAFTPAPSGFVVTRLLDDGRILTEGFVFSPEPFDGGGPSHEIAYSWIDDTETEAAATVAEFVNNLTPAA
ncbi:hypothetical protein [Streptomyces antibioticus]|uniref:Uncharacterized protein n=1 Tax=Streptomyces antibioticus TaxID=1890 RepID=A0AAE6YDV7_STRAT|nr:hypothetical protein [Streptomyces antibioticus]OOQ47300.1 hypothetical protein AFM16_31665 [Streptomyces antibioticus]QIT47622.1 hypothetical protein HCX60_32220 [Streptomyces antibioticus]